MRGALIVLAAGAMLLGGCGGDRSATIAQAKNECLTASGQTSNVNAERLCDCVVERASAGRSDGQVREIFGSKEPEPEEVQAVDQCMAQAGGPAAK